MLPGSAGLSYGHDISNMFVQRASRPGLGYTAQVAEVITITLAVNPTYIHLFTFYHGNIFHVLVKYKLQFYKEAAAFKTLNK